MVTPALPYYLPCERAGGGGWISELLKLKEGAPSLSKIKRGEEGAGEVTEFI